MRWGKLFIIIFFVVSTISVTAEEINLPQVYSPNSIAKDKQGNTYIAGMTESKIYKLDNEGNLTVYAGTGVATYKDGDKVAAAFRNPYAVAVDSLGNVFVADSGNNMIRKINSGTGMVSTFAGGRFSGNEDGRADQASFNFPVGLVIDHQDNLYVSDQRNHTIRKINKFGEVSTVAGSPVAGYKDGAQAQFRYPGAIALDPSENIYILDGGDEHLRMISKDGTVKTITDPSENHSNLALPKPALELERIALFN